jgi:hypothetical protein
MATRGKIKEAFSDQLSAVSLLRLLVQVTISFRQDFGGGARYRSQLVS